MGLPVRSKELSMTRKKIKENTYLTYIPSEKFKTSFFSAQMIVPLARETAGLNALLVNVLSRGTVRCPDMAAIGRELDMLYGARLEPAVRKKGENQMFGFVASCVDDRFLPQGQKLMERMADLLGEFWCDPVTKGGRLLEDYVDSERENLADLIRSDINDKRSYAARRLMEEMCREEPYGVSRIGRAQDVEKISLQRLNRHYKAILPTARLELFYCGSAREERVIGAFTRAFAALPRQGEALPAPTTRRPVPPEYRLVAEEMDVTQGKLCLGFRTDSADMPATMLMNTMFGGYSNSKLFLNVREKLSLCYYAGSAYHRLKGIITVSSGIEFANYDRAVEEIFAQLEAIRRGEWEDWELEGALQFLLNGLRSMKDSAGALEDYILGQAAVGGDETLEGLSAALRQVTPQRIQDAAAAVGPDTVYFLKGKEEEA
ncbi:MAG: insulinase family protein [Oscillospiraceae bacterium]|nr:insulinase family protein [Oscillospiraceae bacterium]